MGRRVGPPERRRSAVPTGLFRLSRYSGELYTHQHRHHLVFWTQPYNYERGVLIMDATALSDTERWYNE